MALGVGSLAYVCRSRVGVVASRLAEKMEEL